MADLYHVTYHAFLDDIAEHGLVPGGQGGFREGYWGNKGKGYVFLTDRDGVAFWYGNLQQHAEHSFDNPYEEGRTPVILRIRGLEEDELEDDEQGSRDSMGRAYKVPFGIDAVDIEVWTGERWAFPERDAVDDSQAWTPEEEEPDEEGDEPRTLYWAKSSYENPLEQPDYDAPWDTSLEQVSGGFKMVLPSLERSRGRR